MAFYETEIWPWIPARDFVEVPKSAPRSVRLIVIHDMEFPEKMTAAEDVARYFQHPDTPSSAHVCVDCDSVIQCVHDKDVAYAAPGCNHDGIQVELAGFGKQTRNEWWDRYSLAMLAIGADVAAQYCLKYTIPAVHLSNPDLKTGRRGIIGHYQATQVYPGPGRTHTDPGSGFPWPQFIAMVQNSINFRTAP